MKPVQTVATENRIRLRYFGSMFWLVFWLIVWFPVGLVLFFTASGFEHRTTAYSLRYDGSRFWLGFWTLIFFPVAIILMLVNGVAIYTSDRVSTAPDSKNEVARISL